MVPLVRITLTLFIQWNMFHSFLHKSILKTGSAEQPTLRKGTLPEGSSVAIWLFAVCWKGWLTVEKAGYGAVLEVIQLCTFCLRVCEHCRTKCLSCSYLKLLRSWRKCRRAVEFRCSWEPDHSCWLQMESISLATNYQANPVLLWPPVAPISLTSLGKYAGWVGNL